jgi:spermidine/putrescine transport system permease protein
MKGRDAAWLVVMGLCLVFMVGPLALVVLFSFGSNTLIGFPMGGLTLSWYGKLAADEAFRDAARISLVVATSASVLSTMSGTLAAFALGRAQPKWARPALAVISVPVLLPPLVVAIAIVVLVVRGLGLRLGLPVVILGHVLVTQPFVILIVMARLASFGTASVEAARDLGATRWQAFRLVTLPQIRTAIIGAALISAAISLDDFIIASFTIGGGNTLSTFVWGKLRTTLDPSINAIATILLLSTIGMSVLALRLARYRG